jgi:hypothetical protein
VLELTSLWAPSGRSPVIRMGQEKSGSFGQHAMLALDPLRSFRIF